VLSIAGNQVPVIPLFEVVDKAVMEAPEQIGVTELKVGGIFELTTIVSVDVVAQTPEFGLKL
jgi:hypothetical protein